MAYYLGLTGGIASGKSTVSQFFQEKGITVIDADQISHQLQEPGEVNWQAAVANFGRGILRGDQTLDRQKLGQIVFADPAKLELLNKISQPNIRRAIQQEMRVHADERLVVVDLPLLFEQNYQEELDGVLLVYVDSATQLQRLEERNHLSKEEALKKIKSQWPLSQKISRSQFVLDNSGTIIETSQSFEKLWHEYFEKIVEV